MQFPTSAFTTTLLGPAILRKEIEVELHDTACKNVGKPGGGPNGRKGPGDSFSSLKVKGLVGIAVLTIEHLTSSYTVTRRTTWSVGGAKIENVDQLKALKMGSAA